MRVPLSAAIVTVCLLSPIARAAEQTPTLSRQQRELLQALVTAVDNAAAQPENNDVPWHAHVFRASDGSHYLAFSAQPPAAALPSHAVPLYIRLDYARPMSSVSPVARSPIREWLAGERTTVPLASRQGIVIGEMPIMGATSAMREIRQPMTAETATLAIVELERRRAREKEEERERERRAKLEGRAPMPVETVPFEDFDLASTTKDAAGTRIISRALTAGPGEYFLYAAWADPAADPWARPVHVIKKAISLPPASSTDLTLSSIIVADDVRVRAAPYPPAEQAAHPYSIGITEVLPAADSAFTNNEELNVFFQVINARPSDTGKPDVEVAARIVRVEGDREQSVASLTPLTYSAATMPPEFDLRAGHPVLAALAAPLATLSHGSYRLKIIVNDRVGGRSTQSDVEFSILATPASLLKDAPALAPPFQRSAVLATDTLAYLVQSLRPAAPSPALQRALDKAAAGQFIELMVEEPVAKGEEGIRAVLTGISQLSVGDAGAAVQFQRGVLLGAAIAPSRVLSGAARAMQGRDADAIAGWLEAQKAGAPGPVIAPLLLDAYIRRADYARAATLVTETKDVQGNRTWTLGVAAMAIAQKNEAAALTRLDAHLAAHPNDIEARWLRVHALYSQLVGGNASARARFEAEARAYIEAKGTHSAIAEAWLRAIS